MSENANIDNLYGHISVPLGLRIIVRVGKVTAVVI